MGQGHVTLEKSTERMGVRYAEVIAWELGISSPLWYASSVPSATHLVLQCSKSTNCKMFIKGSNTMESTQAPKTECQDLGIYKDLPLIQRKP